MLFFATALLLSLIVCSAKGQQTDRPLPFFNARSHQTEYVGPAGDSLVPEQIDEVRIGYFGPPDATHPSHGRLWQAAQLAIRQANQEGGYRGKPFRLLAAWSDDPWGTGVKQLTRLVYQDRVWAIVGGIDGASTHLAEQVVAKARLVLVSPVSTDKSINLANVPWMFSVAPGDHLVAKILAPVVIQSDADGNFAMIAGNDHDSHLQAQEVKKQLARLGSSPHHNYQYGGKESQLNPLVGHCLLSRPKTVLVIARADHSAHLVMELRRQGFTGTIFGGTEMGRSRFLKQAGQAADGVVFPRLADRHVPLTQADPQGVPSVPLSQGGPQGVPNVPLSQGGPQGVPGKSRAKTQREEVASLESRTSPLISRTELDLFDDASLQMYDAVQLVTIAIRQAGLNRAEIEKSMRSLSPWTGISGVVQWDKLGSNMRQPHLGTIRCGAIVPFDH